MSIPETATAMIIMNQGDKIKKLEQKLKQETLRREEAEKVIEFYADQIHYDESGIVFDIFQIGDDEYDRVQDYGEKAREYKTKYKDENTKSDQRL